MHIGLHTWVKKSYEKEEVPSGDCKSLTSIVGLLGVLNRIAKVYIHVDMGV